MLGAARRIVFLVILVAVAGCQPGGLFGAGIDSAEGRVPAGTLDQTAAAQALQALVVAPPAELSGYDRDCGPGQACSFGPAWSDDVDVAGGHNGCDTRNDMLNRDLHPGQLGGVAVAKRLREPGRCVVLEGVLDDPYTGKAIHFTKDRADAVQVDHVVALAAAWRAGAAAWQPRQRHNFANDPRNLLVVDASTNQSKGDATADEWQPPNNGFHCEFARVIVTVKAAYQLTVTLAEKAALQSALQRCPPPPSTSTVPPPG